MAHTKLYIAVAVLACVILFLNRRTRLTLKEKKQIFALALAILPIVGFTAHFVLSDVHDEAYEQQTRPTNGIRDNDTALTVLAWLLGAGASLTVLGVADRIQRARTEDYFAELEREQVRLQREEVLAIERAKLRDQEFEMRKIEGRQELARLEGISRMLQFDQDDAARSRQNKLSEQVEALKLAHSRFARRSDPYGEKSSHIIDDEFRHELAGRSIGKLDLGLLSKSDDPFVRHILGSRPTLPMTPGEAKSRNQS